MAYSLPSRIYNVMVTRVLIAVDAGGDAAMTLKLTEHRAGWHLTPNDADGLKRLVRHLDTTEGQNERGYLAPVPEALRIKGICWN